MKENMNTEGNGKLLKHTFFGTEIGEREVGNNSERDGVADGQTSKSV